MFAAIGRGVVRHPWFVIIAWVLLAAGAIASAPDLGGVTNADQSAFLPSDAESARAARLAERVFPDSAGATGVLVVKRVDGAALTDADLGTIGGLAQRLRVFFDPAQTVAPNRSVAMLVAQFGGPAERQDVRDAVVDMRAQVKDGLAGSPLTAGMTGQAAIVVDNKQAFADAELIVTIATLLLIVTLLLVIFRSPVAALLPLLTVGLVLGVSTALVSSAATLLDFKVGQELPTMLTVVLFGIGTDYILFLLFRYRERLRAGAGDTPAEAIVAAVARVGEAISSAAFAVIAAFGALVLATLGFFTTLGPALAIGVAVMLLAALTLVPAVVSLLGHRVFWPVRPKPATKATHFAAVGRFVARRPVVVVVVSVLFLGALTAGAFRFQPTYDPIAQLPAGTEATKAYSDLKRGFPAGALNPTTIYLTADRPIDPATLPAFIAKVGAVGGVASPMRPQVAADGKTVAVPFVLAVEPYGIQGLNLVSGPLRDAARAAAPPGTTVLVGGQSMAFADVRDATDRDLRLIFPVAGLLFMLILAGLLRAFMAPIYLVAMVVLGFAATLGATTLVFQDALANVGLGFIIPIILYLFVTAIGTDYNILMTARLREELKAGNRPREAAALAVEHAGPAIAAAAVILAGTFGSLLISGVPFFAQIGFAVTVGIALVAFVVSMLLVPAMTALTARPSRHRQPSTTPGSLKEKLISTTSP